MVMEVRLAQAVGVEKCEKHHIKHSDATIAFVDSLLVSKPVPN